MPAEIHQLLRFSDAATELGLGVIGRELFRATAAAHWERWNDDTIALPHRGVYFCGDHATSPQFGTSHLIVHLIDLDRSTLLFGFAARRAFAQEDLPSDPTDGDFLSGREPLYSERRNRRRDERSISEHEIICGFSTARDHEERAASLHDPSMSVNLRCGANIGFRT
jgi:hypothetical protein